MGNKVFGDEGRIISSGSGDGYSSGSLAYGYGAVRATQLSNASIDIEAIAAKLISKMYESPVILVCIACDSANAITNPTCVRCGCPLGQARMRNLSEARLQVA